MYIAIHNTIIVHYCIIVCIVYYVIMYVTLRQQGHWRAGFVCLIVVDCDCNSSLIPLCSVLLAYGNIYFAVMSL